MAGTTAMYQGFPCRRAEIRRTSGLEPSGGIVEIYCPDFRGLAYESRIPELGLPDLNEIASLADLPQGLKSFGTLTFFEDPQTDEVPYATTATGLHILKIEKANGPRSEGWVVLTLTDDRAFWERGFMDRWRFNVENDAGFRIPATVYEDVTSIAGLVSAIVSRLYGSPFVSHVPESWKGPTDPLEARPPEMTFSPFERPKRALSAFLKEYPARVVLHLDRTVGFYLEGEGKIGHSRVQDDNFDTNEEKLPRTLLQGVKGQGYIDGIEFGNTPQAVLVVGGSRYQTVDLACEPVVMVRGEPMAMAEGLALLHELSKDEGLFSGSSFADARLAEVFSLRGKERSDRIRERLGDETLVEWYDRASLGCLKPRAKQDSTSPAMVELYLNAFKLWQVSGANKDLKHLMPVLPQAETDSSGKRLAPAAFAETFKKTVMAVRYATPLGTAGRGRESVVTSPVTLIPARDIDEARANDRALKETDLAEARRAIEVTVLAANPFSSGDIEDLNNRLVSLDKKRLLRMETGSSYRELPFGDVPPVDYVGDFGWKVVLDDFNADQVLAGSVATDLVAPFIGPLAYFLLPEDVRKVVSANMKESTVILKRVAFIHSAMDLVGRELRSRQEGRSESPTGPDEEQIEIFLNWSDVEEAMRDGLSQRKYSFLAEAVGKGELSKVTAAEIEEAAQASGLANPEVTGDVTARYKAALTARNTLFPFRQSALQFVDLLDAIGKAIKAKNENPSALVSSALEKAEEYVLKKKAYSKEFHPGFGKGIGYQNYPAMSQTFKLVDPKSGLIRFEKPVGHIDRGDVTVLDGRRMLKGLVVLRFGRRVQTPDFLPVGTFVAGDLSDDQVGIYEAAVLAGPGSRLDGITLAGDEHGIFHRFYKALKFAGSVKPEWDPDPTLSAQQAISGANVIFGVTEVLPGESLLNELEGVDSGNIHIIYDQKLVELIQLDGTTNAGKLSLVARERAENYMKSIPAVRVSQRLLYFRPLRVNCNGIIHAVRIATRQGNRGCETQIFIGDQTPAFDGDHTRERDDRPDTMRPPLDSPKQDDVTE